MHSVEAVPCHTVGPTNQRTNRVPLKKEIAAKTTTMLGENSCHPLVNDEAPLLAKIKTATEATRIQ